MKFELPPLPYAYEALEPFIDAQTMRLHHDKHHRAYADKFNAVLEKYPDLPQARAEDFLRDLANLKMEEADRTLLKNNGGGYVNHAMFWQIMGPQKEIDRALANDLTKEFGSVDEFKKVFNQVSNSLFGSGWTWLVKDGKKLSVYSLPNQDSPLSQGHEPVICLDLWEHAYYLKYQNRRAEYIENWWNVLKIL